MKKPILYLLLLLSTNFLSAQGTLTFSPSVPSVTNGIVDFTFDLVGGGAEYDLLVEASFDNGTSWGAIPASDITGQLNNVAPGNISLQWDAMASFTGQVTSDAVLRVTARHVCGSDFEFEYNGTEVTYGTVLIDYGGSIGERCWMDRNLGAEPMPFVPADDATGSSDTRLYGDLFQWGRLDDGHQEKTSTTTSTLSVSDVPGHGEFIATSTSGSSDWRIDNNDNRWNADPQDNNPCPSGWRVPTEAELDAERQDWSPNTSIVGAYSSALKWPLGGRRGGTGGAVSLMGDQARVWSSSVAGTQARCMVIQNNDAFMSSGARAVGMSVRCIRNIE